MNRRIASFFLLCALGVMGLSTSALASGKKGNKLSAKQEERIRREERERAAGLMGPDAARLQSSGAMTQTRQSQIKCGACEQLKSPTSFSQSRLWPCNQFNLQHPVCDECDIGKCDVCNSAAPQQQQQGAYPDLRQLEVGTLRAEQGQQQQGAYPDLGGLNLRLADLHVSDPPRNAQCSKPSAAAVAVRNLGPMTATQMDADDVWAVWLQFPNGGKERVTIAKKDIETWTGANLKEKLRVELKYEGEIVLFGKTLANGDMLNQIEWSNGVVIHARIRVNGGE